MNGWGRWRFGGNLNSQVAASVEALCTNDMFFTVSSDGVPT